MSKSRFNFDPKLTEPKKTGPSPSKIKRAKARIRRAGVEYSPESGSYILPGIKSFSDEKNEYEVWKEGNDWRCSCQSTMYGSFRRFCTHILAVRITIGEFDPDDN